MVAQNRAGLCQIIFQIFRQGIDDATATGVAGRFAEIGLRQRLFFQKGVTDRCEIAVHKGRDVAGEHQIEARLANFPAHHVQRFGPDMAGKGRQLRSLARPHDRRRAAVGEQGQRDHVFLVHAAMVIGNAAQFQADQKDGLFGRRTEQVGGHAKANGPACTAITEQRDAACIRRKAHGRDHPARQAGRHCAGGRHKHNLPDIRRGKSRAVKRNLRRILKHPRSSVFIDLRPSRPGPFAKIIFRRHGDVALLDPGIAKDIRQAGRQCLALVLCQYFKNLLLGEQMIRQRRANGAKTGGEVRHIVQPIHRANGKSQSLYSKDRNKHSAAMFG